MEILNTLHSMVAENQNIALMVAKDLKDNCKVNNNYKSATKASKVRDNLDIEEAKIYRTIYNMCEPKCTTNLYLFKEVITSVDNYLETEILFAIFAPELEG